MSEMVERVARAIVPKAWRDRPTDVGPYWENNIEIERLQARAKARVAIAAMREPTEAVVQAVARPGSGGGPNETWMHDEDGRTAWQSGIDAALSTSSADPP